MTFPMNRFWHVLLLLFISAIPAQAGDFTLFGGFQRPGSITLGSTAETVSGGARRLITDPKDFGVFGARLNRSNAPIGLEHTLAYSPNFIDSEANALIYNTNLLVGVPLLPVRPYATAGAGVVRAGGDGAAAFGTKFSLNYGGGVKFNPLGPIGARLDVRGYAVRNVEDQTLHVLEASIGLMFSF